MKTDDLKVVKLPKTPEMMEFFKQMGVARKRASRPLLE